MPLGRRCRNVAVIDSVCFQCPSCLFLLKLMLSASDNFRFSLAIGTLSLFENVYEVFTLDLWISTQRCV